MFLAFMIQCFVVFSANAQPDPPSVRCISVESNGNVTLNWLAPANAGTVFGGYHIYMSNSASGPFVPVDSIFNIATLTTTITTVNANNATLYFYIKTRDGCCNNYSVPSDTLRTMRMLVTALSNESVRLNWNRIHTPPLATTLSTFTVSKELSAGIFTAFRTTTDTTTNDTNYYCSKFINYRVTQGDASGCTSKSSADGELFRDVKGPSIPVIDTVSIDPATGLAGISWLADSSLDTQGYVIYQFNGTSYDSIGAASGINTLDFVYTLSTASSGVETFSVAAFDSCRNLGPLAVNHSSMFLQKSFDKCAATVSLDWTPYLNLRGGLLRYEVWYRINHGNWVRDAILPSNVLTYDKYLTAPDDTFDFFIRAVGNLGQTASSNIRTQIADIFVQPSWLYLRYASVNGSSVEVKCDTDPAGDVISYRLYRGNSSALVSEFVGEQSYDPSGEITFTDFFAEADERTKFYKVTAVDSCGNEQVFSNIAQTVFLSAEANANLTSDLAWTDYSGWPGATGQFNIYRVENGVVAGAPFAFVNGDTLFFTEDVSGFPGGEGNLCYVIEAIEDSVNSFGFQDRAFSNIACAPQQAVVFIPNAFTPEGKNPVFRPITIYDDPGTYMLLIYNRWGQLVFESENPELGWNGTYQNNPSPSGAYAYILTFKGFNKKEVRRTGTVMLIR